MVVPLIKTDLKVDFDEVVDQEVSALRSTRSTRKPALFSVRSGNRSMQPVCGAAVVFEDELFIVHERKIYPAIPLECRVSVSPDPRAVDRVSLSVSWISVLTQETLFSSSYGNLTARKDDAPGIESWNFFASSHEMLASVIVANNTASLHLQGIAPSECASYSDAYPIPVVEAMVLCHSPQVRAFVSMHNGFVVLNTARLPQAVLSTLETLDVDLQLTA